MADPLRPRDEHPLDRRRRPEPPGRRSTRSRPTWAARTSAGTRWRRRTASRPRPCDPTGLTLPGRRVRPRPGLLDHRRRGRSRCRPSRPSGPLPVRDYCSGTIWSLDPTTTSLDQADVLLESGRAISAFGLDRGRLRPADRPERRPAPPTRRARRSVAGPSGDPVGDRDRDADLGRPALDRAWPCRPASSAPPSAAGTRAAPPPPSTTSVDAGDRRRRPPRRGRPRVTGPGRSPRAGRPVPPRSGSSTRNDRPSMLVAPAVSDPSMTPPSVARSRIVTSTVFASS